MNYYLDTEFLEGTQTKKFLGLPCGNTKPTIDLISIGLVSEDNREYYAISKEFNLKEAWNRYDVDKNHTRNYKPKKVYWVRENVLKPIYNELANFHIDYTNRGEHRYFGHAVIDTRPLEFNYKSLKYLINIYGKTNQQITEEVKEFVSPAQNMVKDIPDHLAVPEQFKTNYSKPKFYGYYADYDWVVFAWLFGKMIDLPTGFPMYCNDLKQELDNRAKTFMPLKDLKNLKDYPKQTNEHNALSDARWNKELHNFLNNL
jgi:hypothetical protein